MYRTYRTLETNEFILVAVDTASGGGDNTAAQFLSKTKIDIPLVYHSKTTTSDYIPTLADTLNKIFDITGVRPVVALERNNGGAFLMDRLAGINHLNKYDLFIMPTFGNVENPDGKLYGWNTSTATRPKALSDLKDAIDKKVIKIYDRQTIQEMYSFVTVQTSSSWKAQAERGAKDDLCMALAVVWQMYQICNPPVTSKQMEHDLSELPVEAWRDSPYF